MLKTLPACLHSSCICFVLHYSYSFLADGGPSGLPRSASCCWLIFPLAGKAVLLTWFICTALLLPGSLLRHGNFLILNRDLSISLRMLKNQPNIKSNQTLALHSIDLSSQNSHFSHRVFWKICKTFWTKLRCLNIPYTHPPILWKTEEDSTKKEKTTHISWSFYQQKLILPLSTWSGLREFLKRSLSVVIRTIKLSSIFSRASPNFLISSNYLALTKPDAFTFPI